MIEVTYNDDVIDSRDLLAYIEENETELKESGDWEDFIAFKNEFEDYADEDMEFGAFAISEDYFTDYCREYLQECDMIPADLPGFIENNIDWEGVADEMRVGYAEISFAGNAYLVR